MTYNEKYANIYNEINCFENLINNSEQWCCNPCNAARQCLRYLYSIIIYNKDNIDYLYNNSTSKNDFESALELKADSSQLDNNIQDIYNKLELFPNKTELQNLLDEKASKNELENLNNNTPKLNELKKIILDDNFQVDLIDKLKNTFINKNDFNEIINTKANKEIVINSLHKKANKTDIENIIKNINDKIKEDKKNLNEIIENSNNKIKNEIKEIDDNIIKLKTNNKTNEENNNFLKNNIYENNNSIIQLNDKFRELNLILNNEICNLKENLCLINKELSNNVLTLNDYKKITTQFNEIENILNKNKLLTYNDLEINSNNLQNKIKKDLLEFENFIKNYIKNFENDFISKFKNDNNSKINFNELYSNYCNEKINQELMKIRCDLQNKLNKNELDNYTCNYFDKFSKEYLNKVDYERFDSFINDINSQLNNLKNEIMLKANITELTNYIKNIPNIEEINKIFNSFQNILNNKSNTNDLIQFIDSQNNINSLLFNNNLIAKYIWNSTNLKNNFIQWDKEVINNCKENIVLDNENNFQIIINLKGIYNIVLGIYSLNDPTIDVYVNGENILTKNKKDLIKHELNDNTYELLNKEKIYFHYGLTLNEFLYLNEKSRLSILYNGDKNVSGFLSIKKII